MGTLAGNLVELGYSNAANTYNTYSTPLNSTLACVGTSETVFNDAPPKNMTALATLRSFLRFARIVSKLMLRSILDKLFGSFLIHEDRKHSLMDHLSFGSTTSNPQMNSLASLDMWRQSSLIKSQSPVRIFSKRADWFSSKKGG